MRTSSDMHYVQIAFTGIKSPEIIEQSHKIRFQCSLNEDVDTLHVKRIPEMVLITFQFFSEIMPQ